ncbi:Non-structural protein NS-S [Prevotella copri DSM 18205]|nr:Non-structural protein NS-S [Segatella copri DSM 18205]
MGPHGIAVYSLQLIVYSLRLISWLFADNLQISCDSLGGFEEKA